MGKASFKKRDLNRFRKVYPYIRKQPVYEYCSHVPMDIEVGEITFTATDTGSHTFSLSFTTIPTITAISYDSTGGGGADVNIYVHSLSTTSVTFKSSAPFTGKVHFQAIRVECP